MFDEAESLFQKDQVADACPKYAESYRLDPQLGVLIYLAECYEKNGQLSSAWGAFREAEELAAKHGDERQAHAHERSAALLPRLDRLEIIVPPAARIPGLIVLRDSSPVAIAVWGTAADIDAGKHVIQARAPGFLSWRSELVIGGEARSATITVPVLQPDPTAHAAEDTGSPRTSRRIAAIAVGGVGLVGLGVGGFFGLSAQSSYSDSKSACNDSNVCTAHGKELRDSAHSKALVSTVASGVGLVALATAAVVWFTAPNSSPLKDTAERRAHLALGPSPNAWGMEVTGAF
ncbi:MAG TPA: hypothetical protein VGL19_03460 [Polyangiaceae bacterium]|jgi:hypothetical protein